MGARLVRRAQAGEALAVLGAERSVLIRSKLETCHVIGGIVPAASFVSNSWPRLCFPLDCSGGEVKITMERPFHSTSNTTRLPASTWGALILGVVPAFWTQQAAAHIRMDQPVARNVWAAMPFNDPIKQGPCGSGQNDPRSTDPAKINTYAPGETITVSWEETIDHPGFYRISLDLDGQDDFVTPTGTVDIQDPPVLPVLKDGIQDETDGTYSVEVTLPNETCDNCTLQLIQFMDDSDESYFVCADLVIAGEVSGDGDGDGTGGAPDTTTEPAEGAGGGIASGTGGQGSGGAFSTGGNPSGSGPSTGAGGQLPSAGGGAITGDTDQDFPGPSGDDEAPASGCAMSPAAPPSRSALLGFMGVVGLIVLGARRRLVR
jgi:hypothetical protein